MREMSVFRSYLLRARTGKFGAEMRADLDKFVLTVGGVVQMPGAKGYLHPYTFRDIFGETEYQKLLARPRVICEYDYEESE